MDVQFTMDIKDAFLALASVGVVVWTGVLVLKTAFKIPSTWGVIGVMDLLQSSFIASILGLVLPPSWYQDTAIACILYGLFVYVPTIAAMKTRSDVSLGMNVRAIKARPGAKWPYVFSAFLYFAVLNLLMFYREPLGLFIGCFVWFFVGLQLFLVAYHGLDDTVPKA